MKAGILNISVTGSTGRMGCITLTEILKHPDQFRIASALVRQESPFAGKDVSAFLGGHPRNIAFDVQPEKAFAKADVIIDFSQPEAALHYVAEAQKIKKPIFVGTTGFTKEQRQVMQQAASHIPLLLAPNASLGIATMIHLVQEAAKALGSEYDVEIIEMHHSLKKDKPSGTALHLSEALMAAGGRFVLPPISEGELRPKGAIGFSAVRAGSIIGQHDVLFAGPKEILTISHQALDRSLFAEGALKAAAWLKDQKPGLYTMQDVIKP